MPSSNAPSTARVCGCRSSRTVGSPPTSRQGSAAASCAQLRGVSASSAGVAAAPGQRTATAAATRCVTRTEGPGIAPGTSSAHACFSLLSFIGLFVVLARTLLGLGVVVAALERHPVGLDVLAARQESDQASPGTRPAVFHTTSNWPSARTSPMNTGLVRWWFGSIFGDAAGEVRRLRCRSSRRSPCSTSVVLAFSTALTHMLKPMHVRFHRVVGHALRSSCVGLPLLDERVVGRVLDALEVVPRGEVADERLRVDARELFFTHRERHHRNVFGRDLLVAELLVERHVGVAVDGRDHRGLLAGRAELLDVGHDASASRSDRTACS